MKGVVKTVAILVPNTHGLQTVPLHFYFKDSLFDNVLDWIVLLGCRERLMAAANVDCVSMRSLKVEKDGSVT